MAKQSLAMMVFMAMVSEGYAVRVGAKTDAQAEMFKAIRLKFQHNETAPSFKNLTPWKQLIAALNDAETLNIDQAVDLQLIAEGLQVDRNVIDAVRPEVAKIQMVLDAIEKKLPGPGPGQQSSQSVDGKTVVSDTKTTMLLEIQTVVESGQLADTIRELVFDKASATSFVDVLLEEAEDKAALSAQNAKRNVLSAIESELREHPMSQMLLDIKTMVKNGELADQIFEHVTDKASAKTFVAGLLEEASPAVQDVYLFSDLPELRSPTRAEIAAVIADVTAQRNAAQSEVGAQSEVECLNAQIVALNEQLN